MPNISNLIKKISEKISNIASEIDTKLSGKANSSHTHDDRYYTESEIDTKLSGKSDTTHNHNSAYLGITAKAESAKSADSIAWDKVSGRPTALSQFSNDSGYITTDGAAYPRRVGGVTMNFNWSGQGGQPTWLWGGEDGTNMYVYNPANFSVNYANSAGNADTVDGFHEYSFLRNRGSTSANGEGTLWSQIGIKEYYNALPDGLSGIYNYGETVSFAGSNVRFDIYCSHHSSDGDGLYYRSGWNDDKKDWRRFIDSVNIGSQSVNYANSAGSANDPNAWHSDGATWNPGANVSLSATGNGQEWSFDIHRNGHTGCYWHVWEDNKGTLLGIDADSGAVSIPYNKLILGSTEIWIG